MGPTRTAEAAWEIRSGQYREWLPKDEFTLLLAERDGEPIAYAVVSIGGAGATWDVGDRWAEVETLSVLESERGGGVGKALMDAADEVATEAGAERARGRRRAHQRRRAALLCARGLPALLRHSDEVVTGVVPDSAITWSRRSASSSRRACAADEAGAPVRTPSRLSTSVGSRSRS